MWQSPALAAGHETPDRRDTLYCTSTEFLSRMNCFIAEIEAKSDGVLSFVEYIPLPYFGNTILRFDIQSENYTLEDLDQYEAWMQAITGDDFLVDFMGTVYQRIGFEPWMYEKKFRKCFNQYQNIPIVTSQYQNQLTADGALLLKQCGLPSDKRVWEIQIEGDIILFLLGKENRTIGTYSFDECSIHVCEVDEISCIGLMRASMYAKTNHISLVRVLLEV